MGDALFLVLEYLLPSTNAIISTGLYTLANSPTSANGYELLWLLLKDFIQMFDWTKPFPAWPDSDDIHQYSRMVHMFCNLSYHSGPPYSEAMKSRMFLSHLKGPYQAMALQFNMLVGTYCPGRDGVT
jgi:hypothetical protein